MQKTAKAGDSAKLDRLDWQILYELDCDGAQSFANIGKKLKIGRDVIHYRVRRLEDLGIIRNYISIIDTSKLGYISGAIYVKLQHETPELRKEMIGYYQSRKDVWWLFDMGPPFDFAFGWFGKNIVGIKKKERELTEKYKQYFKDLKLRIYTRFHHLKRNYLSPIIIQEKSRQSYIIEANPQKITDEIDDALLCILSNNARKSYVDVANELRLSAAQVHYRIKSLKERKILLGARAAIDYSKLGRGLFKLDFYLDNYSQYEELFAFLLELPEVVYIYEALGGADLEVDLEVEDYAAVKKIEDKIKSKFWQAISYTEHINFPKEYKLNYFPQF